MDLVTGRLTTVTPAVRSKLAQLGGRGEQWLAGLPKLITELEELWSMTVVQPLGGGSEAFVARVRTGDSRDAVLKVAIPGAQFAGQMRTLEAARGRGYVALLAHDIERQAMLLEALGSSMTQLCLPPERAIRLLCRMLLDAWQVPRPTVMTVAPEDEKAGQLGRMITELWDTLGRPCPERVVRQALEFSARRSAAFDLEGCVVVHGDPHPGNALQVRTARSGAECGFVLIDPGGFLADPAYDLGVVLRDWCEQLLAGDSVALAGRYCRLLADESGVDEAAIWEWGFIERVSSGLYMLSLGLADTAGPFLATAQALT